MCESLSSYTTFGIGGRAKRLIEARTRDELVEFGGELVLGGGSNVLVSDRGYDGTVVINRYSELAIDCETVTVGSGMRLTALCKMLADLGLSGMEWAIGIPGTVGGAVRMNAGAFGRSVSDVLVSADILRGGKVMTIGRAELGFAYRHSALAARDTVIAATFEFERGKPEEIRARHAQYTAARIAKQPRGKSAGSVFKNPQGESIGRLIELAGFKGRTVGHAQVSEKHANVIINTGGATARDVATLIGQIKYELSTRFGIDAQEEIVYIGEFD